VSFAFEHGDLLAESEDFQCSIGPRLEENTEGNQDGEQEVKHELTVLTWRNTGLPTHRNSVQPIDFTIRQCIVYTQVGGTVFVEGNGNYWSDGPSTTPPLPVSGPHY
jgi:hypothetical protein